MDRKLIPISDSFSVNTKGEIFDEKGRKRKQYKNGDGYRTVNIKLVDGRWVTMGVHRLVAMTHIPNGDPQRTQVNHRVLNLEDNSVTNLEWVTPLENVIHSEIMRKDNPKFVLYSVLDDRALKLYRNAYEAADDCGCSILDVWDSVKDNLPINGIVFRFRGTKEPMPESLRYDRTVNFRHGNRPEPRKVKIRNVLTGEVRLFNSIGEVAKHLGVYASQIHECLRVPESVKLINKLYQVSDQDNEFVVFTVSQLDEALNRGKKKVLAFNTSVKKLYIFDSAREFITHSTLSKKAVTKILRKGIINQRGDWVFLYETPENITTLKSHIQTNTNSPV